MTSKLNCIASQNGLCWWPSSKVFSGMHHVLGGDAQKKPVLEVVLKRLSSRGLSKWLNIQDRPSTHFPNPKVVSTLKGPALEKKYRFLAGYKFIIPNIDVTVNKSPSKCIAIYQATFSDG